MKDSARTARAHTIPAGKQIISKQMVLVGELTTKANYPQVNGGAMKRQLQGALVVLAGLVLAGIQVLHAFGRTSTTIGFLFNSIPFALMALAISYVGLSLLRDETRGQHVTRIIAWGLGGAVGFASVSALILFSENVALGSFPVFQSAKFVAIDNITAGTLAGVLVGLYDAQSRDRLTELEAQRDRVESFAKRAADVNNYGRALNQSDTLEEISALCIEALERLVDLRGVAFVERRGDVATIVDSTIVRVDEDDIADLAARTDDLEPATATRFTDDLPADLSGDTDTVLALQVIETDLVSVAIIALPKAGSEPTEETTSLLEMLVAHAGTALENIYQAGVVGSGNDAPEP